MKEEDEERCRNKNFRRFCEKEKFVDKVRDHCHLTGKYRCPAYQKCIFHVTQKQSKYIPFVFFQFNNCDCNLFFKKLVDKKFDTVKFDIIPQTIGEYIGVTYGCIIFFNSYRLLSSSLDSIVETIVDNIHKTLENLKKEIGGKDNNIGETLEEMIN